MPCTSHSQFLYTGKKIENNKHKIKIFITENALQNQTKIMKILFVSIALLSITACGSRNTSANTSDTSVNTNASGNSDGINTIGMDTAHLDTSLGKIKSDSAK